MLARLVKARPVEQHDHRNLFEGVAGAHVLQQSTALGRGVGQVDHQDADTILVDAREGGVMIVDESEGKGGVA